jgi:hypothetical protein
VALEGVERHPQRDRGLLTTKGDARHGSGRVELLDTIKAQALVAYENVRVARCSRRSAATRPVVRIDGS